MAPALLDLIALSRLIFSDKLLGGAFRNHGAVRQTYLGSGLNQFPALLGYQGRDDQRYGHPYRLAEPYLHAGSEAGNALSISGVAHGFIQQAGHDAAVDNPWPPLVNFIRCKLGSEGITIPGKIHFQADGIVFPAPETHTLVQVSIEDDSW
jgi:hypothetical protein